jgi:sigma-E factor negative regulatory protein RseA
MTANQNELLSALVDGELKGKELEQALQLLSTNDMARVQFQRHQLVRDVLHGHVTHNRTVDLTQRIADALLDEPALILPAKQQASVIPFPTQFWKQASGLALAASVGALAVIGVMNQSQNQLAPANVNAMASVENMPTATPVKVAQSGDRWTVGEPEVEDRLNTYLVNHNEYAGASNVFSYARVVSYDAGQ